MADYVELVPINFVQGESEKIDMNLIRNGKGEVLGAIFDIVQFKDYKGIKWKLGKRSLENN